MLHYKSSTLKYYWVDNNHINDVKITYWQHMPILNFSNNNFYFLINFFFSDKLKNFNSLSLYSFAHSSLKTYLNPHDKKKLLPISTNLNLTETGFLTEFFYLRNSSFIKFFINNMIDVPICFKKSKSLKTKNFELPLLKFCNFLMKKGKKEKTFNFIFSAFRVFFNSFKDLKIKINEDVTSWLSFYFFTNNILWYNSFKNKKILYLNADNNNDLFYGNFFINNDKAVSSRFFIKNFLFSLLSKVSPIFSYFIYSVDKNIRKYSRGKSGKYTFIWKYVAPFKRTKLAMRWIIKDIKFIQSFKFQERLTKTFENLLTSPEKSFSWKSKTFSHNYVFKNFRKSLMTSLKTTS